MRADECAAQARNGTIKQVNIPLKDCIKFIQSKLIAKWQSSWDNEINKLNTVKPTVEEWESSRQEERLTEVILCRLLIGHTHLTHNFLLTKYKPTCEECDQELTVNHILISCAKLEVLRKKHVTKFYIEHIPFHPNLLLGDNALVQIPHFLVFEKKQRF